MPLEGKKILDEELKKLQLVIDEAPCTISWVSSEGCYIGVNKVMSHLVGVPQSEFVGKKIGFYTKESHFNNFVSQLFEAKEDRKEEELQSYIDGECKWYYIVGRKYKQGSEAVLIGIDITGQKIAEQQMIFSDRMASLGELSASIIHEINNPLQIISLSCDRIDSIVAKNPSLSDELKSINENLDEMTKRISKIVESLKKYARNSELDEAEPVSFEHIVADALRLCNKRIRNESIQVSVECPPALIVKVRESEISQVLINLINNAVDAINQRPEKWIRLFATADQGFARVKFVDSGDGIPEKIQNKILVPFFTTKPKGQGTGLGLSISKKIIEKHGGKLIYLPGLNNTTFEFTLPIADLASLKQVS